MLEDAGQTSATCAVLVWQCAWVDKWGPVDYETLLAGGFGEIDSLPTRGSL